MGQAARSIFSRLSTTEGSEWIVRCARRDDPRPLWVLVWGGIDDLAQALHDAPDILPKLRVYFIGGPNKKWSVDACQYIATHVSGHGALGDFFATLLTGTMKMGDTPSVIYLLRQTPEDPSQPGWGGRFVRAWERPHVVFDRLTSEEDPIEQFGVFELALPLGEGSRDQLQASMVIENQSSAGSVGVDGAMRFRFSPKAAKRYSYAVRSNVATLDGKTGEFTAFRPAPDAAQRPSSRLAAAPQHF